MKTSTRLTALTAAATLLAAPLTLAATAPAHADVDRTGACGTGRYELSVDRERRAGRPGFEVDADLEGVAPVLAVDLRRPPRRRPRPRGHPHRRRRG